MLIDQNYRQKAIDPTKSFIVQAPAGSGKTSLLVQRFIKLLSNCHHPEEILAITFTKKAALEMKTRILEALESQEAGNQNYTYTQDTDNLEQNRSIYSEVLANPNKLQILTIDAFCASLAQKTPLLSRFGVDLIVAEDPVVLYQQAVEQLFSNIHEPTQYYLQVGKVSQDNKNHTTNNECQVGLIKLLNYFGGEYQLANQLLINMLAKREQWLPLVVPINAQCDQDYEYHSLKNILEHNLQTAVTDLLLELSSMLPDDNWQKNIISLAKQAAHNIADQTNNIYSCRGLADSWPAANCDNLTIWQGLAELLLNKDGKPRNTVTAKQGFIAASSIKDAKQKQLASQLKQDFQELLQYTKQHHSDFLAKLQQINNLPELHYSSDSWAGLKTIFNLLPRLVAYLMLVFEQNQQIDFTQIAIAASEAMGTPDNPTDLALILDHKLNHILVDEFQDTSTLQYNLLEKLTTNWGIDEGKTIFLVGDPMQSIYRFRQANVGLFLQVQQLGISDLQVENLQLNSNFRSDKSIVNQINNIFSQVFPQSNNTLMGQVSYNPAVAVNNYLDSELQFVVNPDSVTEAKQIVELIKANNSGPNNNGKSIAILVRTKAHAAEIIPRLQQHNIAYQANEIEALATNPVIADLASLTKAILHIHDNIAWLSLLRGPLVGLKLADIHAVAENQAAKDDGLFYNLQNYATNNKLSLDALSRLQHVMPILYKAVINKEIDNLAILVKKTWLALGGDLLLANQDLNAAEDFFHKILKITDIFAVDAVDNLIAQEFSGVNNDEIDLNSVQIMTIHKAKGLEFDVVIVPGMDKLPRNSMQQLFLWEERASLNRNYLLFAPIKSAFEQKNTIYNFIKHSENEKQLNEAKRLLYVAMTRCRHKFYGLTSSNKIRANSFMGFIAPYVQDLITEQQSSAANSQQVNSDSDADFNAVVTPDINLTRLPTEWYNS